MELKCKTKGFRPGGLCDKHLLLRDSKVFAFAPLTTRQKKSLLSQTNTMSGEILPFDEDWDRVVLKKEYNALKVENDNAVRRYRAWGKYVNDMIGVEVIPVLPAFVKPARPAGRGGTLQRIGPNTCVCMDTGLRSPKQLQLSRTTIKKVVMNKERSRKGQRLISRIP